MTQSARSKFHYESDDAQPAVGRFCETYNSGRNNKQALMKECVSAGFMVKETGLSDFLLNLDMEPGYHTATPLQKSHILRKELIKFFGVSTSDLSEMVDTPPASNESHVSEPVVTPSPSTVQSKVTQAPAVSIPKFGS